MIKKTVCFILLINLSQLCDAQFLMDMVDTSKEMGKGMLSIYKKFDNVRFSGYMQPQIQVAQQKGARSFNGGDFPLNVNNRFLLRRGRLRIDYLHFSENKGLSVQFVFQFDGTERGVFIRDFWGRLTENKFSVFSITTGMFARPFSYELNLSSSDRESPERGRMSQILLKTERDLGAMISFESRKNDHPLKYLKIDAGLFNGQGLAASADFDSHKDFIGRIGLKPVSITDKIFFSTAASYFNGGMLQNTKYIYRIAEGSTTKMFAVDSSEINLGKIAPRKYYGADAQLKIKNKKGLATEFRAEVITGTQTGTALTSETPAALLNGKEAYFIRKFNGGYFYALQNIWNLHHQLAVKFDYYDPNSKLGKREIGKPGTNTNVADIKFYTLGFGYNYYINANVKLLVWYDLVRNEKTSLTGYSDDVKDNIFTTRLQFRF